MTRFCTPSRAARLPPGARWLYLGKDARARARLEARLGAPLPLGSRLHEEARRLRRPFLDLAARLGTGQADPVAWWAGTLPWKDPGASDLFLLCCCRTVAARLVAEAVDAAVVVEDPWLFEQLRRELAGQASFDGAPSLAARRAAAFALGTARRARWALRMAASLVRLLLAGASRAAPAPGAVAVHSYALGRAFAQPGAWADHNLPGLAEELAAEGERVVRFTDPDAAGWERELAARGGAVEPLLLDASWRGAARALLSRPPRVDPSAALDGRPLGLLLERERWHDLSRAGRCAYVLFHDAVSRFLARTRPAVVVFPWENQPPERMLALAARALGLRTVGVQHTTLPRLQLSFFSGAGETSWAPLPDLLIAAGEEPLRLLREDGWPAKRLVPGGSRRFAPPPRAAAAAGRDVALLLPIDRAQALHLLAAAARAYPAGGEGFSFVVKSHPGEPIAPSEWGFPARPAPASMEELLASCGPVVFVGSTAGLEAMLAGHAALRYRADSLLDVDPCDGLDDVTLPTAGDADFRAVLERLRGAPAPPAPAILARLFGPLDREAWRRALASGEGQNHIMAPERP